MRRILLHGRNHTQLGELAVEQVGDIGAALGRGRHPKAYPHTEPNEDSLVAATDGSFHLMAVADGHNGSLASHSAIEAIDAAISDLVHLSPVEAVSVACQLAQSKLQSVYSPPESPLPATTLTVAVLNGEEGAAGGWGDSVAVRFRGRRSRVLTESRADFFTVGQTEPDPPRIGGFYGREGDRLVLATDGLVDFLARPWEKTLGILLDDITDLDQAATTAAQAAGDGGGGDNIAVCVLQIR